LGLDCEVIFVSLRRGDHRTAEFLALNAAGRVPVLVDGDAVLTESMAIALYLAEKRPERRLIPSDPAQRAQMYRWLFFLSTEMEGPLERMERHTMLYREEQRSPAEVELARQDAVAMAAVLEKHMRGRHYLVGDRLSVADLAGAYTLDWANEHGILEQTPELQGLRERMYAMPSAPPSLTKVYGLLESPQPIDWLSV
jgi:glutathione S-transferase